MNARTTAAILDEYLVIDSQLGDAGAFTRLVERWHPRLLRYAYHFTQDADAAGDVVQESWIAAARGIGTLRDPGRFPAWVLRIVANKARDWTRREQARRRATERIELPPPPAPSDALDRVRAGLAALEPQQRLILSWFYLEEMSVGEIADALGIPSGTVKSRLFHARNALRARIQE